MAKEASINDFGLLIAYVLPGFTALWAASYLSDEVRAWIGVSPTEAPTVGGFLYVSLLSIGAGIAVSTVRWMVIDTIHHRTGIPPPAWDFSRLADSADAFRIVVDHYYRYYQCYGNAVVSLLLVFAARRWALGDLTAPLDPMDLGLLTLVAVFFVGSRDSLKRYYTRGGQLLRTQPEARPTRRKKKPLLAGTTPDRA